jgi:Tfp pilus assembly protein PilF
MNPRLERGRLLMERSRFEEAEKEIRSALGDDTQDAHGHAILALCLAEQKKHEAALAESVEALRLDPDLAFTHHVRAYVLLEAERLREAEAAIGPAVDLDPEEADYRGLLAAVRLRRSNWQGALEAADAGLALDPEHTGCLNTRASALRQLGRMGESAAASDQALEREPEDAFSHVNLGWTLLHAGRHEKALDHFAEALRIEPGTAAGREGFIAALKARHTLYRWILKYFLWMSRLTPAMRWGVVIGAIVLLRLLRRVGEANPVLKPFLLPVIAVYLAFVILSWIADPVFDLFLGLHPAGRHALSPTERRAAGAVGLALGTGLVAAIASALAMSTTGLMIAAGVGVLSVPLAATFRAGTPRRTAILGTYTAILAAVGGIAAVAAFVQPGAAAIPGGLFVLGLVLFTWVAAFVKKDE